MAKYKGKSNEVKEGFVITPSDHFGLLATVHIGEPTEDVKKINESIEQAKAYNEAFIVVDPNMDKQKYNDFFGLSEKDPENIVVQQHYNMMSALEDGCYYLERGAKVRFVFDANQFLNLTKDMRREYVGWFEREFKSVVMIIMNANADNLKQ